MTPEFPRAPISAPKAAAEATRSAETVGPSPSASASAARTVAIMFDPVSPSGTGKTLRALTSSTAASRPAAAARKAPRRPAPSHDLRAIRRPPSEDVRPAVGEVRRAEARPGWWLRRLAAGVDLEASDADRQRVDLASHRCADGVADGVVDLARHLGHREAVGHPQVQTDHEPPIGDRDTEAAGALLDPAEQPISPAAGESGDAV